MKRVLFVDQSQVLGGAELSLIDICKRLPDCSVAVFDLGEFSDRLNELNLNVINLRVADSLKDVKRSGGRLSELSSIPGLASAAIKLSRHARRFDLLYANTQKAMLVAGIAGKFSGRPVIWHLRDLMTTDHFSEKLIRLSVGTANRTVTRIIANSNATAASFIEAGGDASKTTVIHNGVDSSSFGALSDIDELRLRKDFELGDSPVAGVFSRIAKWKGQHVLIEAVAELDSWHVLVVGDALFQNDQEYKAELARLIEARGMNHRVHFVGFRKDVPELMALCDVVVHTSTSPEPFGRVIVEGMLARTPVIAARGGGASEIVRHGENGYLFDAGRPDQLSRLLLEIGETSGRSSILDAAHEEASTYYSVDRLVEDVKKVVNSTGK